ncbi:MAG: hypothetical protein M8364_11310 [Methylobacter sp.]|uniref:hypothetical protein n=1 Tax=Methylobacter sp. TaxID=2051955 RepID=UPI00258EA370|nr:hypothetical protein [Methylobacter sp.]MCL7421480.1 hypothetical protein [Methylobacter sp.]
MKDQEKIQATQRSGLDDRQSFARPLPVAPVSYLSPSLDEQQRILESIEGELKMIDVMRHLNNQAIERLRTALITDAGKIDVSSIDVKDEEAA